MRVIQAGQTYTWTIAGNPWTLAPNGTIHVDSSYFSQYLGSGNTVPVSFATGPGVAITNYPGEIASWSNARQVKVEVQYEYTTNETATPEPCSLALLGLGLGGIVMRRRRKAAA